MCVGGGLQPLLGSFPSLVNTDYLFFTTQFCKVVMEYNCSYYISTIAIFHTVC